MFNPADELSGFQAGLSPIAALVVTMVTLTVLIGIGLWVAGFFRRD